MPRFRRKKKEFSRYAIAADAVGVTHFIIANLLLIAGEFSKVLNVFVGGEKHPGISFITTILDRPVAHFLKVYFQKFGSDTLTIHLLAELVVVGASVLYGFGIYVVFRILGSVFMPAKK